MSRRTVLLAAMVALTGCQGPNSTTTSAFKFPTPSLNLLAPYGSPRIPAPGTYSYGQSGMAPAAAASAVQPYYGGVPTRGVSLPQPRSNDGQQAAPSAQGKVAQAVWKSSRPPLDTEEMATGDVSLASFESSSDADIAAAEPDGTIRIPVFVQTPAESPTLVLGGMRAHDLTRALPREPMIAGGMIVGSPTAVLASVPAPMATRVIYSAPVVTQPAVAAPVRTAPKTAPASTGTSNGLVEITDLPQASTPAVNRSLQRVRGYEAPAKAAAVIEPADTFISPEMTISATAALKARDAVAAAAVESEPAIVKPAATGSTPGWKSRYLADES